MILRINLIDLTPEEVRQFVSSKCSEYGTVKSISLRLYPLSVGSPYAFVEMSSAEENARLQNAIGDDYFAPSVMVYLMHNPGERQDRRDLSGKETPSNQSAPAMPDEPAPHPSMEPDRRGESG